MNDRPHAGMREASRLTRAGRLIDATALLQRMLQSGRGPDPDASNAAVPPTIDLVPEVVDVTSAAIEVEVLGFQHVRVFRECVEYRRVG